MALFLGYDPGGKGKNGVAAAEIDERGDFVVEPIVATLSSACEVIDWIGTQPRPAALGIDTLLAWSKLGSRVCDDALRRAYPTYSNSIVAQNSLYSAMTVNGAMVARDAADLQIRLVESHPKLLVNAALPSLGQGAALLQFRDRMLGSATTAIMKRHADDMADALTAAWCASRWWYGRWRFDLFVAHNDALVFPAGAAVYPWPEAL